MATTPRSSSERAATCCKTHKSKLRTKSMTSFEYSKTLSFKTEESFASIASEKGVKREGYARSHSSST